MKMDKKMEYYLRDSNIEFTDSIILEVIPQSNDHAVVLTAPKTPGQWKYFHFQFMGNSRYYSTLEQMLTVCVEYGYLSQKEADKITKEYENARKAGN